MKNARKRLAMLMAFVMLVSAAVPLMPAVEVRAQPPLNIDMSRHLIPGGAFLVPGEQAAGGQDAPFLVSWDVSAPATSDYRLSYFLNDNIRADLHVFRRFENIEVYYEVINTLTGERINTTNQGFTIWNNVTQAWAAPNIHPNIAPWRGTGINNMPGVFHPNTILPFDMHEYYYGGDEFWGYEAAGVWQAYPGGIVANHLYGYNTAGAQHWLTPSFTVGQGGGFSFRYGTGLSAAEVHFRWTPAGMFEVSTSGTESGRVYSFELSQRAPGTGPTGWSTSPTIHRALKGVNSANVQVTPFGYEQTTLADIRDSREPYQGDPVPLERGFELGIPLPSTLNPNSNTYQYSNNLGFDVYISASFGVFSIVFQLAQDGTLSLVPGSFVPDNYNLVQDTASGRWYIVFDVSELEAGLLFTTEIGFTAPSLSSRTTVLPFGHVFTFPEFIIAPMRDMHVVQVRPFRSATTGLAVHGWYMLQRHYVVPGMGPAREEPPVWFGTDVAFVEIPIRMSSTPEFFQILFNPNPEQFPANPNPNNYPRSQVLHFWPELQDWISIPEGFRITDAQQLPLEGEVSREWAYLEMTLNWDLGPQELMHRIVGASPVYTAPGEPERRMLELIYGVNYDPTPDSLSPQRLGDIGINIVTAAALMPGMGERLLAEYFVDGLDGNDRPWPFELISPEGFVELVPDPQNPERYLAQMRVRIRTAHEGVFGGILPDLRFPGIYFVNVRPISQNGAEPVGVDYSNYYSLTLSDLPMPDVPAPQNVAVGNETTLTYELGDTSDRVSFDLSWNIPGPMLHDYILRSFGFGAERARVSMNIYMSQNEAFMRDTFAERGWPTRINAEDVRTATFAPNPELPANAPENWMRFSEINGLPPMAMADGAGDPRSYLRQTALPGGVNALRIQGIELELTSPSSLAPALYNFLHTMDGLDKNEQYFMFVDVVVEFYDEDGNIDDVFTRASLFSGLVGVTTIGDPDIPTGEDRVPPAPYPLNSRNITSDSATLYWPPVPNADYPYSQIEYEIIRIHTDAMPEALIGGRIPFPQIWQMVQDATSPAQIQAWRTSTITDAETGEQSFHLHQFDGTGFNTAATLPQFNYFIDWDENEVVFVDNTLVANELYFYYVRARRTMGDGAPAYSLWNHISVTTIPIEAPVNLRIVTGRTDNDQMREAWLAFDAPMTTLERFGEYINVELQIREDDGEWVSYGILDAHTLLTVPQPPVAVPPAGSFSGGYQFMYLVRGLNPGTAYQFRVRLIDQNAVASLFSNIATWRTDLDQGEWDDEQLSRDWIDHLRREMERLLRTYYWISSNSPNVFEVFMRPSMAGALIARTPGSQILLPSSPLGNVNTSVYYIPMSMYQAATAANKGFRIENGELHVLLPPGMIDTANNPAVLAMGEAINHREYADSFIRITLNWLGQNSIEGEDVLGSAVDIRFHVVGARQGATAWDNSLLSTLEARLETWAGDPMYAAAFFNAIRAGTTPHDLSRYVLAILDVSSANIVGVVNNAKAGFVGGGFALDTVERSFTLMVPTVDEVAAAVQGFTNTGNGWLPMEAVVLGQGRGIISNRPGSFALTARLVNIPGIQNVVRGGTMTGIVARYGLDDFLGRDEIDLDAWATRHMVIGSAARLAGAPRGADPANWLRARGVNVSARGAGQDITQQEAAALMVHVYEVRTNTRTAAMRIRNQNAINALTHYDPNLRDALRVAIELQLIDPENFQPALRITKRQLLQMLGDIDRISRI